MFSDSFKTSERTSFLALKDGEKVQGVFAGEPLEFKNNFGLKTQYPLGLATYPEGTSSRFKLNLLVPREGKFFPFVFEGSKKTAVSLDAIVNKFGRDYIYEIQRNGSGTSTTYSILPERSLTPEEKVEIAQVKLVELKLRPKIDDDFHPED